MRLDAVFRYHFPFEYWTLTADTAGNTTYSKSADYSGMMLPGQMGGLYLICKEQLQVPMQIRNLRDRSGAVVTQAGGQDYPLYIHNADPQLDPFSNVIAYRHTLRREPPRDFAAITDRILAAGGIQ